jgi:aryl sulfotransferase
MIGQLPQVTRTYQNHMLDSTRWQHYQPRSDDILISTSIKSGTTWTQEIVRQLIFCGQEAPERDEVALSALSPWIEFRLLPGDEVARKLEAQQHRRIIKSHLPLDGLPFFPQVKYIIVGRDARDIAMSLWNQYTGFTDGLYVALNQAPARVGAPFPLPPQDFHTFWRDWITRGWFEWESEGYPYWGNLHHTQSWWAYRHLPNILFVHYSDLKSDLAREIRRIADFLTIALDDEALPPIMQAVSLDAMRDKEGRLDPLMKFILKDGAEAFFYKGTNGRWHNVLSDEELAMYEATATRVLTPDCRAWLEQGLRALEPSNVNLAPSVS